MINARALFVSSALFLGSISPLQAQSLTYHSLSDAQNNVPVLHLSTMISKNGELKEDFILRASKNMVQFTEKTGKEACTVIYQNPKGQTALFITTSNSQLGCLYVENPPPGFAPTQETLHTHPNKRSSSLTSFDRRFLVGQERNETWVIFSPEKFSPPDEEMGPGYLAVGNKVRYQGELEEREVGSLALSGDDEAAVSWEKILNDTFPPKKPKR